MATKDDQKLSLKGEEKLEAKRKAFLNEMVTLTLSKPKSSWNVPRFRLTTEFVQHLIDRTVPTRGVSLTYLKSSDEAIGIVVPSEMVRLCKKNVPYEMILSYPNQTKDIKEKHGCAYQGQMHFVLRNVPARSQNHLHTVRSPHIMKWIVDGILKEDPDLVRLEKKLSALKRSLSSITAQLEKVHEDPVINSRGVASSGRVAERKRQEMYDILIDSKYQTDDEIEETSKTLFNLHSLKCEQIKVSVTQCSNEHDQLWNVELRGEYKNFNEQILLNKASWNTSFMYAFPRHREGGHCITDSPDYLVDTACISIERVEHGFGTFHRSSPRDLDQDQDSPPEMNSDDIVDVYHGTYVDGKYHGSGMMYTSSYIYGGDFKSHSFSGKGTLIFKDGDILNSESFEPSKRGTPHEDLLATSNRYARGEPSTCNILFSDGATYDGEMECGTITGRGLYINANGDRFEGLFSNGVLLEGTIHKSCGETLKGTFKDGQLHGKGSISNNVKRSLYHGHFVDGEKHGMGHEIFYKKKNFQDIKEDMLSHEQQGNMPVLAEYWGNFSNNDRSGLGTMEFRDSGFKFHAQTAIKDELSLDGRWLGGSPIAGGMITNLQSHSSVPTTSKPSSRYRFMNRFKRIEDSKDTSTEKEWEESSRLDGHYRNKVEAKKKQMFTFHRNKIIRDEIEVERDAARNGRFQNFERIKEQQSTLLPDVKQDNPLNANQKWIRETTQSIEKKWTDKGYEFEEYSERMNRVRCQYNTLEDQWNSINIESMRKKAVSNDDIEVE